MVNCDHCEKVFKFDSQLLRHLSSKFPCYSRKPPEYDDIDDKDKRVENKDKKVENKENKVEIENLNELILNALREGLIKTGSDAKTIVEELCKPVKENQCKKCSKVLCNKYYLQKHEQTCNGLNSLQCPKCTKWFSSSSSKSIHMKNVKCSPPLCKPVEETKYMCSKCDKTFSSKSYLKKHMENCNGLPEVSRGPHNQSVYLIIEREFVKSSENIFKLGKTRTMVHRTKKYPNGSNILVVLPCADCDATEKKLLDVFRNTFHPRKDIGSEYFEGDPMSMIKTFMDTVDVCF